MITRLTSWFKRVFGKRPLSRIVTPLIRSVSTQRRHHPLRRWHFGTFTPLKPVRRHG